MFIKMFTIHLGACCLFKLVMTIELLTKDAYDTINVQWGCSYDIVSAYATNNAYLGCFCDLKVFILLTMLTHVAFVLRVYAIGNAYSNCLICVEGAYVVPIMFIQVLMSWICLWKVLI
jgi:hypothetical protein